MLLSISRILSNCSKVVLCTLFLAWSLSGCKDIIERDLSHEHITILAPPDSLTTSLNAITFKWENVEGASRYRLQLVKSDFDYIEQFLLDSAVSQDNFTYGVSPGEYEWRIRAENTTSFSEYQYRKLFIDSSAGLGNLVVLLNTPPNNQATNNDDITFEWQSISIANQYLFEIEEFNSGTTAYSETIQSTSISISDLLEGKYSWKVLALNEESTTPFSTRVLRVDRTPPPVPVPDQTEDLIVVTDTVLVSWTRPPDVGEMQTERSDRFYIYADTTGNPLDNFPQSVDTTFTEIILPGEGIFFWHVESEDEAGNVSPLSEWRKVIRQ